MDDLDDLLDDIEKTLNAETESNEPKKNIKNSSIVKKPCPIQATPVDDDLSDILNDDFLPLHNTSLQHKHYAKSTSTTTATNIKCRALYIGGSNSISGRATLKEKRACDNIRCTSCDFKVLQCNDYEWHNSVDYLFLRNNMPDFNRIKRKLVKRKGCRAYSCQCSWQSRTSMVEIKSTMGLKWVCGKH